MNTLVQAVGRRIVDEPVSKAKPPLMPGFTLKPSVLARKHWAQAGVGLAAGTAAGHQGARRTGHHDEARGVAGAGVGAALGQGVYQAPAYAHQAFVRGRNVPRHMRRDIKQSELSPEEKPLKRAYEKDRRAWKADVRDRGMTNATGYRLYPKHWPNARAERLQGWTHAGRTGQALGATATIAGALAGGHAAVGRRRQAGQGVSKGAVELGLAALGARGLAHSGAVRGMREDGAARSAWDVRSRPRTHGGALSPTVTENARNAAKAFPVVTRRPAQIGAGLAITAHADRRRR